MPDDGWLDKRRRRFGHSPYDACLWTGKTERRAHPLRDPSTTTTGRFRALVSVATRSSQNLYSPCALVDRRELNVWFKSEAPPVPVDQLQQLFADVPGLLRIVQGTIEKARESGVVGTIRFGVTRDRPACVVLSLPASRELRTELLRGLDSWLVSQPIQAHRRLIVDVHAP